MPSPSEIVACKRPGETVVGWKLAPGQRKELLVVMPPRYSETVADHVTLAANVASDTPLPRPATARAVGLADDGNGVEAIVVEIDGTTDRPGGSTYHITWSIEPGREAVESNDVIADRHWEPFAQPLSLSLTPARF